MRKFVATTRLRRAKDLRRDHSGFRWWSWKFRCDRLPCDGIGDGWSPGTSFDAGIHIRVGDACGNHNSNPARYLLKVRRCHETANLTAALLRLQRVGIRNGSLFVATDSPAIISQLRSGAAAAFNVSFLDLNRSRYVTPDPTERLTGPDTRLHVFLEALMDLLLLSRAAVVVGSMISNFPRVALQLRVQPPALGQDQPRYIALDKRVWCTRTSCRDGPGPLEVQLASNQRELTRNG